MQAIENLEGSTMDIEIINCNHGGYYSVVGLEPHRNLGSVQRISPRKWLARKHGEYRQPNPPQFPTRRDAVAHLVVSAHTQMAFLSSTHPLPGGGDPHQRSIPASEVWREAERLGLTRADYGSWWFVYESEQDYRDSLD